jgi:hypothetical protein
VRLKDDDWAHISWRPRSARRVPGATPFDLDTALKRAEACTPWRDYLGFGQAIPIQTSREEAWFWLRYLDMASRIAWYREEERKRLQEAIRGVHAAGCPGDGEIRAWAQDVAERAASIYYQAPQTLRPFFAPAEIATLIVDKIASGTQRPHYAFVPAKGFVEFVALHLQEHERTELRDALERRFDAETDTADRARWHLALLATVGGGRRLSDHVAAQPDGAWKGRSAGGGLDMLSGLADEASFLREARRLHCLPSLPPELRLWLAATEWRALDAVKEPILRVTSKDDAAERARILALVEAPEAAMPMLEVQLGSKAPAIAAQWLADHPLHAAVGLTPAAMGQGRLAEAAREHLHTMRRSGHTAVLAAAQRHLTSAEAAWLTREILEVQEESLPQISREELPQELRTAFTAIKAGKPTGWIVLPSLPPVKVQGKRLAVEEVLTVLSALKDKPDGAGGALITALKQHAEVPSLDAFAWKVFEMWQAMGAPSKDKWAMAAIGRLGGDGCVLKLTPLLRAWPGESQHARAVAGLACLREIGSDTALMALNGIAQKLKFKGLKQKAQEMMEGIAQARGLSAEQLADRIVPDCGLDARGSRVFDFGPRQFRFVLGREMKPLLRDAAGKLRGDLPSPGKSDDQALAEAAVAEWKLLKKTLREVLKVQAERLEDAMISGRRWAPAEFQTLLVQHPLMINLVRQLVLAAYDEAGRITETFRVTEDQTFADHNDEERALPEAGQIGIAHPAHLDEAARAAWGQVLGDYEIIPPFAQLGREICRPEPADLAVTEITRFKGPKIPGIVLYGMLERSHWLRDTPADGGGFQQHSKHFPAAGVTAFIHYTGLSIGYYDEAQELEGIYFVPGHVKPTWWGRHENRLAIKDVDPVVLSEVLRLAHAIVSKGT